MILAAAQDKTRAAVQKDKSRWNLWENYFLMIHLNERTLSENSDILS